MNVTNRLGRRLPLSAQRTEDGCFTCTSHRANADGYVRVGLFNKDTRKQEHKMLHRLVWEAVFGSIPPEHEVDHKCKVRHCVNPNHLQCLPGSQHASKDNHMRWRIRDMSVAEVLAFGESA